MTSEHHLESFKYGENSQQVEFAETTFPAEGVECDVYNFVGDNSKDLGVIKIGRANKTPPQRVENGERTTERYASGNGRLIVKKKDGTNILYEINTTSRVPLSVDVEIGDVMQWEASQGSDLVAYEVCTPPYKDGRYTNL